MKIFPLQAVEQQINKEKIPLDASITPKVTTPRVLSPRSSIDTAILPERIKIPSSESRKSLDFSDRESDSERSISSANKLQSRSDASVRHSSTIAVTATTRKSPSDYIRGDSTTAAVTTSSIVKEDFDKSERSTSKSSSSSSSNNIRDEKVSTEVCSKLSTKQSVQHDVHDSVKDRQDSIEEVSDISCGKDLSDYSDASSRTKSKINENTVPAVNTSPRNPDKIVNDDKYDDDSFENESKTSSTQSDVLSRSKSISSSLKASSRSAASDRSSKDNRSAAPSPDENSITSISEATSEITGPSSTNRVASQKEDEMKNKDQSRGVEPEDKYSGSKFETESSVRSEVSEKAQEPSISEQLASIRSDHEESRTSILKDEDATSATAEVTQKHSSKSSRSVSSSISTTASSQSIVIEPDGFSKSNVSSALGFRVDERVKVEGSLMGTIRYLGKTSFSPVLVAGIELDEPLGTNDGRFHDRQYFTCAQNHGFFTTIERLQHFNDTLATSGIQQVDDDKKVELGQSSTTSTIEEVEEDFADVTSLKLDEDSDDEDKITDHQQRSAAAAASSYSEHFEATSMTTINKLSATKETASSVEERSQSLNRSSSSSTSELINEKTVKSEIAGSLSDSKSDDSVSHDSTISAEVEVPSPRKVDVDGLTDRITDGILKSIVAESLQIFTPGGRGVDEQERSAANDNIPSQFVDVLSEQVVAPRDSVLLVPRETPANEVDNVTKSLLNDAIGVMLDVAREKKEKLSEDLPTATKHKKDSNKLDFLSLIVPDPDEDFDPETESEHNKENEKDHLLSEKINQLKNVHDQLDMLLGDHDDDEDDDNDIIESVGMETSKNALSLKEEQPLRIPLNDSDTRAIVSLALQEISGENDLSVDQLERLIVPDSILALETYGEVDEPSTMLYKTLIFDLTLQLYCESKEFRELQAKPRPSWLKRPRKTFSKFTRQVHLDEVKTFPDLASDHVCSCIGLQSGRPSLTELKRKLPLNLEKKDYVDAVLVDELRQEEGQWVNYDEDELRVKFQLADNILEGLLEETVDILNQAFNKS